MRAHAPSGRPTRLGSALGALALAALACAAPALAGPPAGFSLVPAASGLSEPTAHAYAPDGRLFIAERTGRILVQRPGHDDTRTVFLDLRAEVNANSERGVLGIALDPQFTTRPRVFVFATAELNPQSPDGAGQMDIQVWRFQTSPTDPNVGVPSSKAVVVAGPRTDACCHYGGTVRFDSRGRLLTAFGDTNVASMSQRAGSLQGRLLRIDPETGQGDPQNPFYDPADPSSINSRTLATGFRNPFRFTVDPSDDSVWVGDVGQVTWEEIDRVPATGWTDRARETNFGWPCFEGGNGIPLLTANAFSNSTWTSLCRPIAAPSEGGTGPGTTGAHYAYRHGAPEGASVTGGPVLRGQSFPATYSGRVFIADYSQDRMMTVTSAGQAEDFGTPGGYGHAVDLIMDPYGDVSYAAIGAGAIRVVTWTAGNRPPTVSPLTAEILPGPQSRTVRYTVNASDPDGDRLEYRWSLGDGTVVGGPQITHTYARPISTDVVVTVSDGRRGGVVARTVRVDVGNTAPAVRVSHDAPAVGFKAGQALQINVSATDPEDGVLTGDALSWTATRIHLDHRHPLASGTGATGRITLADHGDDPSHVELTARAVDQFGGVSEARVTIQPHRVRLAVAGGPTGTPLILDGQRVESPYAWESVVGGRHEVVAPAAVGDRAFRWWQLNTIRWTEPTFTFSTPGAATSARALFGDESDEPRTPDSASTRARRPISGTLRRAGKWYVVKTTAGRRGRVSIVVSAGSRRLGGCRGVPVSSGTVVRCRVRLGSAPATADRLQATVTLTTATRRYVTRLRLRP